MRKHIYSNYSMRPPHVPLTEKLSVGHNGMSLGRITISRETTLIFMSHLSGGIGGNTLHRKENSLTKKIKINTIMESE